MPRRMIRPAFSRIFSLALLLSYLLYPNSTRAQEIECMDLVGVDFGDCDMAMGIALIDSWCVNLSGCGAEVDGVDYAPYIYTTIEDCHACTCVDSTLIDPEALCIMVFAPVCGCDGVTYSNDCFATVEGGVTSWVDGECGPTDGVLNPELNLELNVLSSPDLGILQFQSLPAVDVWRVFDGLGRIVAAGRTDRAQINHLPTGLYTVVAQSAAGHFGRSRFFWP